MHLEPEQTHRLIFVDTDAIKPVADMRRNRYFSDFCLSLQFVASLSELQGSSEQYVRNERRVFGPGQSKMHILMHNVELTGSGARSVPMSG